MKRAVIVLCVVALAGCKGREEEKRLKAEIEKTQGEIAALEPQVLDLSAKRHAFMDMGEDFEDVGSLDGPNVWPAVAPRVVDATFKDDSVRAGVEITPTVNPPRNGKLTWTAAVKPGKVWDAARAIVGDPGTEPTALLEVVEASGKITGFFPLVPSEDTSKLLPVPKERPAPVPNPSSTEGKRLAAALKELETKRARLEADAAQSKLLDNDLNILHTRMNIIVMVGDENARQRILVDAAAKLNATALKIAPGATKAAFHFKNAVEALKASKSPVLEGAHLTAAIDVSRLDVSFVGEPPRIKPYEERRKEAATDQVKRFESKQNEAKPKVVKATR